MAGHIFYKTGAENSTTHFLQPAFMDGSTLHCISIWKTGQGGEVKKETILTRWLNQLAKTHRYQKPNKEMAVEREREREERVRGSCVACHSCKMREGRWPSPLSFVMVGWLMKPINPRLYQGSAPSALNGPYCSGWALFNAVSASTLVLPPSPPTPHAGRPAGYINQLERGSSEVERWGAEGWGRRGQLEQLACCWRGEELPWPFALGARGLLEFSPMAFSVSFKLLACLLCFFELSQGARLCLTHLPMLKDCLLLLETLQIRFPAFDFLVPLEFFSESFSLQSNCQSVIVVIGFCFRPSPAGFRHHCSWMLKWQIIRTFIYKLE